jgi:HlyD family secretion protein
MAVIADMSSLVLTINVDELDILSIKVGQTANITADALPGKTFTGTVTSINNIGSTGSSSSSSSGSGTGVTTYEVQISIPDYGSLLPGMNVNASIVIDSATNVLLIPQQAVMNGGFVLKKVSGDAAASASPAAGSQPNASNPPAGGGQYGGGKYGGGQGQNAAAGALASQAAGSGSPGGSDTGSGSGSARMKQLQASIPAGYQLVRVQIGLTDGTSAEVTSGLNEGDSIAYVTPTTSSASGSSNRTGLGIVGGAGGGSNRPYTGGAVPAGGGFTGANRPAGSGSGSGNNFTVTTVPKGG